MSFPYNFPTDFPNDLPVVVPILSWTQSLDGAKIIFKDDTDYIGQDVVPSDYTRTIQLYSGKDASGNMIGTLTFSGNDITIDFALDKDKYISAKFIIYDGLDELTTIINFGTTVNEYNSLTNLLLHNSCGCNKEIDQSVRFGFIYLKVAEKAVIVGNSGAFNKFIDLSRTWLAN